MRLLIINKIAIIVIISTFLFVSCTIYDSDVPSIPSSKSFYPTHLPITDKDLIEANIKQKNIYKISIINPYYENEDYRNCASEALSALTDRLKKYPWLEVIGESEFLSRIKVEQVNKIFFDEPRLVRLSNEQSFDGIIMIEIEDINFESTGLKITSSDSDKIIQDRGRIAYIRFRIKVLNTFLFKTHFTKDITGQSAIGDVSLNTKQKVIESAIHNVINKIENEIALSFKPNPEVIEVRGNGLYIKLNAGRLEAIQLGQFLDIYQFIGVKDPDGKIITIECRKITSVRVIIVEDYSCWCDNSLSQGIIKIGYIAIPHHEE